MELSFQTIVYIIAGFIVGWFLSYIKSRFEIHTHKKELKEYKEHLNRQMKITSEGSKNLEREMYDLKKVNENLRATIQTLSNKPGRAEIKLLNIYDSTLRKMMQKAPGFSGAWEVSLQESEQDYEESEKGLKTIVKKVFGSSFSKAGTGSLEYEFSNPSTLESKEGK
jgi:uncharacterized membrane-anchored protein YhcB (DUF1043 family)